MRLVIYALVWSTPVLILLRVFGLVTASWWIVFTPWLIVGGFVALAIILGATVFKDDD